MATVKAKFRPSTVEGKAGTVYYQLCHRQRNMQITTSIHLLAEEWDSRSGRARVMLHDRTTQLLNAQIDSDIAQIERIVGRLEQSGNDFSLADIATAFRTSATLTSFSAFMEERIAALHANNQLGTARNYRRALSSFSAFLGGIDVPVSALGEELIELYSRWLGRRGVVRNSVSFYMRILRAVYNQAVGEHITPQTSPFRNVYTGIDRTRKRAVGEEVVLRLQRLNLTKRKSLGLARDLFVFSYCMRGMAFVDVAYLRKSDIRGGVITYERRKTKQRLTVRIEPCVQAIIDRYAKSTRRSEFVFPIIRSSDAEQAYAQYQTALGHYNRLLKELAAMVGAPVGLSSYTSRHTWATAAHNHNIPIAVISQGMGHTSESTTRIYLASLENAVIDDANSLLLTALNAGATGTR